MATGMARGAAARGRRIAFGDRGIITWDHHSELIFRGNPNIAPPGSEDAADLEWINYRKGHRIYNRRDRRRGRWIWNSDFTAIPGEMFFTAAERALGARHGAEFVLIEPNVPGWKSVAPNKDWGFERYQQVADGLRAAGYRVCQFVHADATRVLDGADALATENFRDALTVLENARLYIGPEGGLHHGAAAVGVRAVVLFGGFIPPQVTGYRSHVNLTGKAVACGSLRKCDHCAKAMARISVNEVMAYALEQLQRAVAA